MELLLLLGDGGDLVGAAGALGGGGAGVRGIRFVLSTGDLLGLGGRSSGGLGGLLGGLLGRGFGGLHSGRCRSGGQAPEV